MVAPITLQTVHLNRPLRIGLNDTFSYMSSRYLQKQAMPIDRVLPYWFTLSELISYNYGGRYVGGADSMSHAPEPQLGTAVTDVRNRSYSKLRDQINSADMGVNIVEYRQASEMFGKRGRDVLNVSLLLARGKFAAAGRVLHCSFYDGKPPRRNRNKWVLPDYPKKTNVSVSNLWLEWHFGWSPLIDDCQKAAKVLTDPLPKTKIRGSAETFVRYNSQWIQTGPPNTTHTTSIVTRVRNRQGALVGITNPNVALAGQLGLLNPAALAWEIVPFSFVVDWFVNVGDWLQGFTDFAGMTLLYPYSTVHLWSYHTYSQVNPGGWGLNPSSGSIYGKKVYMSRVVGLTAPTLAVRPLKLPSLSRIATIWSLASQNLQRR